MNRQEYLVPLKNKKIYNLKTNTIRERTSEDIFNFECDVEYLQEFDESFSEKYFNDLFCNKQDLKQVVLNIVKSCIVGKSLRYIFFLTGDGNNGKSLFMDLLKEIFGNFIDTISRSVLLTTKATTHLSTEFEKLGICRIGYVSEMSDKDELNVPIVKQITGDRYINVRGICKTDETLEVSSNQFALTNKMPKIKVEKAINNRLVIIPFMNSFELNDEYKPLLFSHKNDIFNYIMKYGIMQTKFDLTEDMINSKQDCIDDNTEDELQTFIDEKCNLIDGKKISRNEFIKTYNDWLVKNHKDKDKRTTNKFTRDMRSTYKINSKESNGKTYYLDIEWKFSGEDEEWE
jgi:putative DNA primase/helicase